ncbi:MAG TPA: hypothetical protein VGF67_06990 [Ktedonobacteraceae bacterium]
MPIIPCSRQFDQQTMTAPGLFHAFQRKHEKAECLERLGSKKAHVAGHIPHVKPIKNREQETVENGQGSRSLAFADLTSILTQGHISSRVELLLNRPVVSDEFQQTFWTGLLRREACDTIHVWDAPVERVMKTALEPKDLSHPRPGLAQEVIHFVGSTDGALFQATMAEVGRVSRLPIVAIHRWFLKTEKHILLQGRLVSFGKEEIIPSCRRTGHTHLRARMQGVCGDHAPFDEGGLNKRLRPRLFAFFLPHDEFLDDDPRFRLIKAHVMHLLLIVCLMVEGSTKGFPIAREMSLFFGFSLFGTHTRQEGHPYRLAFVGIDCSQDIAAGGRTRKGWSNAWLHFLQPLSSPSYPFCHRQQRGFSGGFRQQEEHLDQGQRRAFPLGATTIGEVLERGIHGAHFGCLFPVHKHLWGLPCDTVLHEGSFPAF